ncbi:MAG: ATPase [Acidobacteria bacterium]|nr:ATPase [Acidobacteriota bacterium]
MKRLFLGVDGGQSHTEALVADETGTILGRGIGGPSNHAEQPGGRDRLRNAVIDSVSGAGFDPERTVFEAAHFGMTGGADYKEEIIGSVIRAGVVNVGHDAPTALYGATGGKPGIVVIAGTGSVVYGENSTRERARAGGLGYLFSDEGSGFWIAAETIRLAIREQDGVLQPSGLEALVLDHFEVATIRDLTTRFYNGFVTRETVASFAKRVSDEAEAGNQILVKLIRTGAGTLVANVSAVARRLGFEDEFVVSGVGGVFRGLVFERSFRSELESRIPSARFREPVFGPATGSLLLAYRSAKIELSEHLLSNLKRDKV